MFYLRFVALGDVHVPRYFPLVVSSVNSLIGFKPDIILLAGDIVDRGDVSGFDFVRSFLRAKYPDTPIVSVFGNEEYSEREVEFVEKYRDVVWLDDSSWVFEAGTLRVCVCGSRGSLERLTPWQSKNAPYLRDVYEKRIVVLRECLLNLRSSCDLLILLMHYSPTYLTLRGEPESVYKYLAHRGFERVILETRPDLVVHAHSHNSKNTFVRLGASLIINVSVPALGSVFAGVVRKSNRDSDYDLEIIAPQNVKLYSRR